MTTVVAFQRIRWAQCVHILNESRVKLKLNSKLPAILAFKRNVEMFKPVLALVINARDSMPSPVHRIPNFSVFYNSASPIKNRRIPRSNRPGFKFHRISISIIVTKSHCTMTTLSASTNSSFWKHAMIAIYYRLFVFVIFVHEKLLVP